MSPDSTSTATTFQVHLEEAIHTLVDEFVQAPYAFFTEADAVARFQQLLDADPLINGRFTTADGFTTGLVHREYPTFFRFSDKHPTVRLGPPASRGHYDTAILNPAFVKEHPANVVPNRDIKAMQNRDTSIIPFQAVIEFKLDNLGWSAGRCRGTIAELGKLRLSDEEAPLRYFVVLMRYCAPNLRRWEKYWPTVKQTAEEHPGIGSVIAVRWLSVPGESNVFHFGAWGTNGYRNPLVDNALRKILDQQIARDEADMAHVEARLCDFETQYGMESETFWTEYQAGHLADSADYVEWNAFYKMRQRLAQRLAILRGENPDA